MAVYRREAEDGEEEWKKNARQEVQGLRFNSPFGIS